MKGCIESKCRSCFNLAPCTAWIMHSSGQYSGFSYSVADCPYYVDAADVVERKRGEWVHTTIEDEDWGGTYHRWTCSVCGGRVSGNPAGSNFCKWCGADMRGE